MTFSEFLAWYEYEIKGIPRLDLKKQIPSQILPPTGFIKGGAKSMRMVKAEKPARPIFRKAGSSQPSSGS